MQIIWIATGVVCLGAAIRFAILSEGTKVLTFTLLALISFLFAWLRHNQRKKS